MKAIHKEIHIENPIGMPQDWRKSNAPCIGQPNVTFVEHLATHLNRSQVADSTPNPRHLKFTDLLLLGSAKQLPADPLSLLAGNLPERHFLGTHRVS